MKINKDDSLHEQEPDAAHPKKLLNNRDLLLLLNATVSTLRNKRKKGYLPFIRFGERIKMTKEEIS